MTRAEQLLAELVELYPEFKTTLAEESDIWSDSGKLSCHGLMAVFSHYVAARLSSGDTDGIGAAFRLVEEKLASKIDEVSDAVSTCFLENLLNRTPIEIAPESFVPLLGPASREFCRAWDQFCGCKTQGLW